MTDPERCGAVVVTLPESLPVTEAFELSKGLEELEVPMGALVLNRMPENPFSEAERKALDEHIRSRRGELLLGTRELPPLERALEARKTFRDTALGGAHERAELPVYEGRWNKIIEQVATGLVEAGVAPGKAP